MFATYLIGLDQRFSTFLILQYTNSKLFSYSTLDNDNTIYFLMLLILDFYHIYNTKVFNTLKIFKM